MPGFPHVKLRGCFQPSVLQTCLTNWHMVSPKNKKALSITLKAFIINVENTGVEPVTSCMPCKRSSQLS